MTKMSKSSLLLNTLNSLITILGIVVLALVGQAPLIPLSLIITSTLLILLNILNNNSKDMLLLIVILLLTVYQVIGGILLIVNTKKADEEIKAITNSENSGLKTLEALLYAMGGLCIVSGITLFGIKIKPLI